MLDVQDGLGRLLQGVQLSEYERQFVEFWGSPRFNLSRAIYGAGRYMNRSVSAPEVFDFPWNYAAQWLQTRVSPRNREVVRAATVLAYLLSEQGELLDEMDCASRFPVSRLEGEVRRHAARQQDVPAAEIPLSPGLLHDYCDAFRLEPIEPLLMERLGY
ncbi:hypothetical protein HYY74_00860 [Candidatus Woesearchaeota archaeon]|nr:hypothetical protein [Candidatus Woesearchaeota archaeon]